MKLNNLPINTKKIKTSTKTSIRLTVSRPHAVSTARHPRALVPIVHAIRELGSRPVDLRDHRRQISPAAMMLGTECGIVVVVEIANLKLRKNDFIETKNFKKFKNISKIKIFFEISEI
jgi:hypothetical protein